MFFGLRSSRKEFVATFQDLQTGQAGLEPKTSRPLERTPELRDLGFGNLDVWMIMNKIMVGI